MNTIGNRIKEIRNEFNLTQDKFGEKIGVKKSALSLIEKNERSLTDSVLRNILSEFCVNENWLKDGVGEKYDEELRKKKSFVENELVFMKDTLRDRQQEFFSKISNYDEDVQLEINTALEEIYSLLNAPEVGEEDYFDYFESISGLLLELKHFVFSLSSGKLVDSERIHAFIKSFNSSIIELTNIIVPDIIEENEDDAAAPPSMDKALEIVISEKEQSILAVYRSLPESDKNEIEMLLSLKQDRIDGIKKKTRSSAYGQDEEAATTSQLKIG